VFVLWSDAGLPPNAADAVLNSRDMAWIGCSCSGAAWVTAVECLAQWSGSMQLNHLMIS